MLKIFDFCTDSRVVVELPPQEPSPINLNGWDHAPKPSTPYQRTFKVTLHGLKWYLTHAGLLLSSDSEHNAGRLLKFYRDHRLYRPFILHHEYLGAIQCRFNQPVEVPAAVTNSNGLIEPVEINMVHHNPGYE